MDFYNRLYRDQESVFNPEIRIVDTDPILSSPTGTGQSPDDGIGSQPVPETDNPDPTFNPQDVVTNIDLSGLIPIPKNTTIFMPSANPQIPQELSIILIAIIALFLLNLLK